MDALFVVVPAVIVVVGVVVVGAVVVGAVVGLRQWGRNNAAPVLSIPVTAVGKRTRTSGGAGDTSASTSYYVTFERTDGYRFELRVRARDYALIADRDRGTVTFQGTRFKAFDRVRVG